MFADVQLHLQEDAVYSFAAPAVGKIHVVLETKFGKFARVKRKVRGKSPPFAHQIPLCERRQERHGFPAAGAVRVVNPEAGYPAIRKSVQHLRVETKVLETGSRNWILVVGSSLVIPVQIFSL